MTARHQALGLHAGTPWWVLCLALATPFVPFYVATWEEYYTHELILPIINGPSEGVALGVGLGTSPFLFHANGQTVSQ